MMIRFIQAHACLVFLQRNGWGQGSYVMNSVVGEWYDAIGAIGG